MTSGKKSRGDLPVGFLTQNTTPSEYVNVN